MRARSRLARSGRTTALFFMAPFLLLFLAVYVIPVLYAVVESFFKVARTSTYGPATQVFAGLEQYTQAVTDSELWAGMGRVLVLMVVQIPITLVLAVFFALVIDSPLIRGRRFFRLAFFAPYAVPSVIAAIMWGYFYAPSLTPLPALAQTFDFLSSNVLLGIGNILTWTVTGFNMLIVYSALQSVPQEVYEAAKIDGAGEIRTALSIKLPLVAPAVVLAAVFSLIGAFQLFNEPTVLRTLSNAVSGSFTPNMLIFNTSAIPNYNFAAALSVILALATCVVSLGFLRLSRRFARS